MGKIIELHPPNEHFICPACGEEWMIAHAVFNVQGECISHVIDVTCSNCNEPLTTPTLVED